MPLGRHLLIVSGKDPVLNSSVAIFIGSNVSNDLRKIGAPNEICKLRVPIILALSKRVNFGGPIVNPEESTFVLVLVIICFFFKAVL